jgi:hypothetical protein
VAPVDGLSAEDAFNELYAVRHIAKGKPVKAHQQCDGDAQRFDRIREMNP